MWGLLKNGVLSETLSLKRPQKKPNGVPIRYWVLNGEDFAIGGWSKGTSYHDFYFSLVRTNEHGYL